MVSDSHPSDRAVAEQARGLNEAVAAIEARLDGFGQSAGPGAASDLDAAVAALAVPVKAFAAAAKGAIR